MNIHIAEKTDALAALCRRYGVARLEVFGSAARSTDFDEKRSDADFLVTFTPATRNDLAAFADFKDALENLLERAYALGAHEVIAPADLPPLSSPPPEALSLEDMPTVAQAERRLILRALQVSGKDRDRAARILGISRRTLYRRLKHYGVL